MKLRLGVICPDREGVICGGVLAVFRSRAELRSKTGGDGVGDGDGVGFKQDNFLVAPFARFIAFLRHLGLEMCTH